jgi:hypothetical protein
VSNARRRGDRGLVEADRVAHLTQLSDQLGTQRLNLADAARVGVLGTFVTSVPFSSGLAMPPAQGRLV